MKKDRIYKALPWPLQNAACNLYGWKEKRLRMSRQFESYLASLIKSEYVDIDVIKNYQASHVSELIGRACKYVPFYKERYAKFGITPSQINSIDDLAKLPTLSKQEVINNKLDLVSLDVAPNSLVKSQTSGTTGTALEFYKTREAIAFQWAVWWRHRVRFGFAPGVWHGNFTGKPVVPNEQTCGRFTRKDFFRGQVLISGNQIIPSKVERLAAEVEKNKLSVITGYGSLISHFCDLCQEAGVTADHQPRLVVLGAENVSDLQRETIQQFWGAEVTDQYGFSEGAGNASRCEYGNYHEDWEFGVLECVDPIVHPDGSRTGRIVATGFADHAFPFIRYEVGDTGTWAPDGYKCPCGRQSKVLWDIDGRNEDYVVTPEGNRVRRWDYLFKDTRSIREAQVVQRANRDVVIRIVPRSSVNEEDLRKVRATVSEWISPALQIEFDVVDEIERSASGKFKPVVSELEARGGR